MFERTFKLTVRKKICFYIFSLSPRTSDKSHNANTDFQAPSKHFNHNNTFLLMLKRHM